MKLDTKKLAILAVAAVSCGKVEGSTEPAPKGKPAAPEAAPRVAEAPVKCGGDGPARGKAELGQGGTFVGAMSAGKVLQGSGGDVFAAFELTAPTAVAAQRPPLSLALVVDRSGSMSGEKFDAAKQAALGIVQRLADSDRVTLVQYDDRADVVVPSIATDRAGKARLADAIRKLEVGGGTNLHGGMMLGQTQLGGVNKVGQMNRVILLSDGQANSGVTDPRKIADAARQAADQGIRLTAVGLGLDYNEDLMEAIAEAGRGNYYYVKDASGLDKVMAGELTGVQATIATGVELHLRPACAGVEITEVLGYETRRDQGAVIVPMADLFGGDSRKLLVQLKVPHQERAKLGAIAAELKFRDAITGEPRTAAVALAVEISDDQTAVALSVDQEAMAQVMSAQAATTMRQAALAYDKGDVEGAAKLLDSATQRLESDRARYKISAKPAADAVDSLREMKSAATAHAPGSSAGKDVMKATKAKARAMSKMK